ncbi:MAG TPA: hypothetical protein VF950_14635 [Planctomycetota bacterium]
MTVDYSALFAAIDAKPFKPFKIELVSGRQVDVNHPENVLILPDRNRVQLIEVYWTEPFDMVLIWPGGFAGLLFPASEAPAA